MKLYRYIVNKKGELVCKEYDGYEEKEKWYSCDDEYPRRIAKDRIGMVRSDPVCGDDAWLTERDDGRAAGLFVCHLERKCEKLRSECEGHERIIDKLKQRDREEGA